MTPFTKIVQEWRLKSWPSGVTSTVTITIKQSKEDTRLFIKQTGVPAKEVTRQEIIKFLLDIIALQVDSTKEGWHRYYIHAMKRSFGFGSSLF